MRFSSIFLAVAVAGGCMQSDPATQEKLDQLSAKLDSLDKRLTNFRPAGGRGAAQRPQGPDPASVYSVPIDDADPIKGPSTAKVSIVEAAEFACPFCRMAEPTLDEIAKTYGDDVRFVFKHYVVHPDTATTPALATCAAQRQGKFWEMKHAIWESAWDMSSGRPKMKDRKLLAEENMVSLADGIGLDVGKFKADLAGAECKAQIAKQQQTMAKVGVDGTPAFFVNGRPISGALPFAQFKVIIDEELKKADLAIKGGVKAEDYYRTAVVEKGKKTL
jgi:protein-disulfide isomerase